MSKLVHQTTYFPKPQFGKVQTWQFRHRPPSPRPARSSAVTGTSAMSDGRTRSKIVRLAYMTQPGRPTMGRRRRHRPGGTCSRQDRSAVGNHAGTGILDGQRRLVIGVDAHATGTKDHIHALSQHILDSRRDGRRVIGQGLCMAMTAPYSASLLSMTGVNVSSMRP